jgi:hypothetical protein
VEVKENSLFSESLTRQLAVFTGKGGVGKTSVAAAYGLAASRAGKRVLLVEVRSPRRIPSLFELSPDENGPLSLHPGVSWINLTAETALETYAMTKLRLRSVYRAVFEQRMVRRFLRAIPSLAEILMLGHLAYLIESGEYDLAVVDAPSTGPGAQMLQAPRQVFESVSSGPLHDSVTWIHSLLADPLRTQIHIVVLPEELPVTEAVDLHHKIRDDLMLPMGFAFANRVLEDPFPTGSEDVYRLAGNFEVGRSLTDTSTLYRSRLRLQEAYLDRLRAGVDLPCILLPEVTGTVPSSAVFKELADELSNRERENLQGKENRA